MNYFRRWIRGRARVATRSTHIQCFKSFIHLSFFLKSKWNRSQNQYISDNQNCFWLRSKWKTKSFYDRCRMSNVEYQIPIHSYSFKEFSIKSNGNFMLNIDRFGSYMKLLFHPHPTPFRSFEHFYHSFSRFNWTNGMHFWYVFLVL